MDTNPVFQLSEEEIARHLLVISNYPIPEGRARAMEALLLVWNLSESQVGIVAHALEIDPYCWVRYRAIEVLKNHSSLYDVVPYLKGALSDNDPSVFALAHLVLWDLVKAGNPQAQNVLNAFFTA